jgi:hypothetical protein
VTTLRSASRHYRLSALIAKRAAREATKVRKSGILAVAPIVAVHQATAARASEQAVAEMLAEQEIESIADALLNVLSFTTSADALDRMIAQVDTDAEFERLVESMVQDAARAAESVSTAVRADIWHVRYLSPPSCSRCAVLAGRVYRYSDGFQRHPNCDCVMIPTTVAKAQPLDLEQMVRDGQVIGLSKADRQALTDGADLNQIVNVRLKAAGLKESGRVLERVGRPTPEGIYAMTSTRTEAVALLRRFGYVR